MLSHHLFGVKSAVNSHTCGDVGPEDRQPLCYEYITAGLTQSLPLPSYQSSLYPLGPGLVSCPTAICGNRHLGHMMTAGVFLLRMLATRWPVPCEKWAESNITAASSSLLKSAPVSRSTSICQGQSFSCEQCSFL